MNSQKYPYRVTRAGEPQGDLGQHKTVNGAAKRIAWLVKASNGRKSRADFVVVNDSAVTK